MLRSNRQPRTSDGRKSFRNNATRTGKIVYRGSTAAFNCIIRDISKSGARISLSESNVHSNQFYLVDLDERIVHEAKVVWMAYSQRGLRFIQSYPIDQRMPPHLEFARRLWTQSAHTRLG